MNGKPGGTSGAPHYPPDAGPHAPEQETPCSLSIQWESVALSSCAKISAGTLGMLPLSIQEAKATGCVVASRMGTYTMLGRI